MAFASDDTYPAGSDPWSGQPNKVAPSGGYEATGFVPGEPASVEFLNYELNRLGVSDDGRRLEKVCNYRLAPDKDQTGLGTTTPYLARATWGQRQLYAVSNGTKIQISYNEGTTWADDDTLASAVYSGIASYQGATDDASAVCASLTLSGAARVSMRGETATWNDQALTGGAAANHVVVDQDNGYFWVVGQLTAGTAPAIWGVEVNDGATGGTVVTAHPGAGSYALETCAVGGGYGLAARTGGTGLWRWDLSTLAVAAVTPPGIGDVRDILWNEADGAFYLCQAQGGQGSIWKSSTGATGSWTSVGPGDGTETRTWALNGGCTIGRVTALVCTSTALSVTFVLATDDGGISWHRVGQPTLYTLARLRRCGNGIVASSYGGASMASHAFGLRGGLPL